MPTVFLTSSPTGPLDGSRPVEGLDRLNRFVDNLSRRWKPDARCLMIAAHPWSYIANDEMTRFFAGAFPKSGLTVSRFDLWDARVAHPTAEALHSCDVILLGGGHVPTQNAYFQSIRLRELLAGFDGLILGISAGSMNSARTVYVQPELPGEAADPHFVRWAEGLGLTEVNLIPHYQMVKDNILDGVRLFEDATYPDSYGHPFLAIPDGSYLLIEEGKTALWGEGYIIENGSCTPVGAPETATPLP